ncbi:P-II family nitrogen regulator [Rheinheimera sp. NSM]|uniref:P-II family nitrogen regulator n=1 Tax=Rheinheimera sp. NSM TaxID=3457884 RepID=UPI004036EB1D
MKFSIVVAITPEELEQHAIEAAQQAGAAGITLLNGRGIGAKTKKTFFGMTFEGSQSVLLMVVAKSLAEPVLAAMHNLLVTDGDSRGLAFSLPIEHLTGIDLSQLEQFEQRLMHSNTSD